MKRKYPYLRDPRVISEIRKHQWIESEKKGEAIGFGSAASDWINKYGEQWEKYADKLDKNVFIENRKFRRFELDSYVALVSGGRTFSVKTVNISPEGLVCRVKESIPLNSKVRLQWSFDSEGKKGIVFCGTVVRSWQKSGGDGLQETLISFDEESQKKIENLEFLR